MPRSFSGHTACTSLLVIQVVVFREISGDRHGTFLIESPQPSQLNHTIVSKSLILQYFPGPFYVLCISVCFVCAGAANPPPPGVESAAREVRQESTFPRET
jgi:hypothetical protein